MVMAKVGRFISDPKAGAYCDVVLDNGDKLLVNHSKGGFKGGWLTIEKRKWLGSDVLFKCDLDSAHGKEALAQLTKGIPADDAHATPLYAFVEVVRNCGSADEVKARCGALVGSR
jgi:hypothetical protein